MGIGIKKGLEENFGKVGGKIIGGIGSIVAWPAFLIGTASLAVVVPIIIAVFGGLFIYQIFQGNLVSSLVPPKNQYSLERTDYNEETSGVLFGNYSGVKGSYINSKNGVVLYVFETGSKGGRMTQRYDLKAIESSSLEKVNGVYLDKRAAVAYQAMVEKARKEGIFHPELNLISGYRDSSSQRELWKEALLKYGSSEKAGIWASNPDKGLSAHATGRAMDIVVNGGNKSSGGIENQKQSSTAKWLTENEADFGFYN